MTDIITYIYGLGGIIACSAYIPQIYKFINNKNERKVISLITWSVWSFTAFTTFLYATFIVDDGLFSLVSGLNFCGTLTILILGIFSRKKDIK